ncbi:MAG TPA: DUF4214 domain-containing protein [Iamia sp.]
MGRDRSRTAARPAGGVVTAGATVLLSVVALVGGVLQPAAAGPVTGVATWETAVIDLPNGAIAYDASRDQALVAVAPSVPTLGNHLVELDPHTGELGRSVPVGADPRTVAVSDDGTRAYVGGVGSSYVTEVDLATFTVVREIFLGNDTSSGGYYAEDIEVQPGHPSVIAVSLRNLGLSPRHEGVAIYDAGVRRATMTPGHTGPDRITWSDDPATLYGYNDDSTSFGFFVLTVGPSGVTATTPGKLIEGFGVDVEYADGEVVGTNGQVVDVETLTLADPYTADGEVEIDTARDTAYLLDGTTLTSHSTATKAPTGSRTVPAITPTSLVDAGTTLVASGPSGILLLGEDVTAAAFSLPAAPESRVRTWGALSVPIAVEELAGAPDGSHVYGVVRQGATQLPGHVVEISTATGQVTDSVEVGDDPYRIGISSDGSTILVGHEDATKLTEIATADLSIRRTIALPSDEWANDIAARPGTAATFAVVLVNQCCSPRLEGQILVQDGVVLAQRGPGHTGATSVTFASDPNRLYGVNGGTTDYGFYTLQAGSTGLTALSSVRRLSRGFSSEVTAAEGLVYTSTGTVIDPTVPAVVGSIPSGQVVPVPAEDRLLVVSGSSIQELDPDSLGAVATHPSAGGTARDATAVGSHLAIATTGGQVVIVPVGDPEPAVTELSPTTGEPTGDTEVTVTGTALRGATAVRFGSTDATSFTVVSDTEITAVAPAHDEGEVDVTVTTPGGTSVAGPAALYTYEWPGRSPEESWVWAAFDDFLDREPTPEEVAAAVARLESGVPRATLARELATSDEWIAHLVTGFYTDTLGRDPSEGEVAYWASELRSGRRTVAQVAASFYASQEYFAGIGGGTTSSWIEDLYTKLLGRTATAEDVEFWSGQVTARGRGWVALQMFQSLESRRARVTALYQELLGRAPDAEGRDYWADRLTTEGDIALARNLAVSAEYVARARTRFP